MRMGMFMGMRMGMFMVIVVMIMVTVVSMVCGNRNRLEFGGQFRFFSLDFDHLFLERLDLFRHSLKRSQLVLESSNLIAKLLVLEHDLVLLLLVVTDLVLSRLTVTHDEGSVVWNVVDVLRERERECVALVSDWVYKRLLKREDDTKRR